MLLSRNNIYQISPLFMFKKALIVENHEMTSLSIAMTLKSLGIKETRHAYYCDDALLQIKKFKRDGEPFDLLVTDLAFDDDCKKQQISGGIELITLAKYHQPKLKVLVFSAEKRFRVVDSLFKKNGVNGYVKKSRFDSKDFASAIKALFIGRKYVTDKIMDAPRNNTEFELTEYDLTIIQLLSKGVFQKEIPKYLRAKGISPNSLSSVEKRLNTLREAFEVVKNEQLIAYCKDHAVI